MGRTSILCCLALISLLCAACRNAEAPVAPPVAAADSATVQVTEATFAQEVLGADQPVLVDFWAPWCKPCLELAPIVEELAEEYEGRVKMAKVNVEEQSGLAAEYEIQSIPALLFFRDGRLVERAEGLLPKRQLAQMLDAQLAE